MAWRANRAFRPRPYFTAAHVMLATTLRDARRKALGALTRIIRQPASSSNGECGPTADVSLLARRAIGRAPCCRNCWLVNDPRRSPSHRVGSGSGWE